MELSNTDKLVLRWGEIQEGARQATKNDTYTDEKYYYELCEILAKLAEVDPPIYSLSQHYTFLKNRVRASR